jgi:hypothetical protein
MAAKQKMFELTNNLDIALEQKALLAQLHQTHGDYAEELLAQQQVGEAKLQKRRELLKARRKNKQVEELEASKLADKIELIELEQREKRKLGEDYIRSLFKREANS